MAKKTIDIKDLKRMKDNTDMTGTPALETPAVQEGREPETKKDTGKFRISVDLEESAIKRLNAIVQDRQEQSITTVARAGVLRELVTEAINKHYKPRGGK